MNKKKIPVKPSFDGDQASAEPAPLAEPETASPEKAPGNGGKPERVGAPESDEHAAAGSEGELAQLRAELDEAKDRALRCQAELENYRRRVAREFEQERRYAAMPLLRDLLPVWDNVHRAIEAGEHRGGDSPLLEGFKIVADQLEDVLRRHDCVKIDALWQPFDPNVHEAITQQPSEEHPPGTVVGETQTGFRLHDRVVRPSQVLVSAAMPPDDA